MPILSSKGKSIKINNCKWENSGITEITRSCLKLDFAPLLSFFQRTKGVFGIFRSGVYWTLQPLKYEALFYFIRFVRLSKVTWKKWTEILCVELGLGTKLVTCLRPMSTSYRNQWNDLQRKLTAWFLYDSNTNL